VLADSGYVNEENFARADADGLRLLAPLAKDLDLHRARTPQRTLHMDQFPATARARRRLLHPRGRDDYKMGARTVEPVFGQLKTCQNFTMMPRRGFTACENRRRLSPCFPRRLPDPALAGQAAEASLPAITDPRTNVPPLFPPERPRSPADDLECSSAALANARASQYR